MACALAAWCSVSSVEFDENGRIEVRFQVINRAADLIRGQAGESEGEMRPGSSVVSIGSKGMLGDKLLQISVGSRELPVWDPSTPLPVDGSADLMAAVGSAMTEVRGTAENLRLATDPFRTQVFSHDVERIAANLARVSDMLANGDGALQHLMTEPSTAAEIDATLQNLRTTSDEFARTARSVRRITEEVERGDGSAHALIYGDEARTAVTNIGDASGEIATLMRDVRTGDGTVHDLIYGDTGNELIANLTQASADVAAITGDIRAGRGTIGGLLQDPSIYEDIKRLVGDLERNEILRALVRYSVRRDEARRPANVEPSTWAAPATSDGSGRTEEAEGTDGAEGAPAP